MATTTTQPTQNSKETLLGMTLAIEQRYGCKPKNDKQTTLNTKFDVFKALNPTNPLIIRYFCWGNGGQRNDTESLSSAQPVLGTNMAPYSMRPFRAVPLEQDLSAVERAKYAMRQVKMIGGVPYCLYYLKLIDFTTEEVQYIRTDPVSGAATPYLIDHANLSPTPPAPGDNGIIADVADTVSVALPGTLVITGQEVLESAAVMDGGDMRYASVSEIGMVSASTQSVSATDFANRPFSYNEAIMAQMVDHYTSTNHPFFSVRDVYDHKLQFSIRNLIGMK